MTKNDLAEEARQLKEKEARLISVNEQLAPYQNQLFAYLKFGLRVKEVPGPVFHTGDNPGPFTESAKIYTLIKTGQYRSFDYEKRAGLVLFGGDEAYLTSKTRAQVWQVFDQGALSLGGDLPGYRDGVPLEYIITPAKSGKGTLIWEGIFPATFKEGDSTQTLLLSLQQRKNTKVNNDCFVIGTEEVNAIFGLENSPEINNNKNLLNAFEAANQSKKGKELEQTLTHSIMEFFRSKMLKRFDLSKFEKPASYGKDWY